MRQMTVSLCFLLVASVALAHGGGAGQTGSRRPDDHQKSAAQMAIENHRSGLEYLEAALLFEHEAANASQERKKTKFLKKAQKQFKKAKRKFALAIEYEPQLFQSRSRLGYAQHKTGDYDAALRSYDIALSLKPRNAQVIGDRAQTYLALGRLEETKLSYEHLLKVDRGKAATLMSEMLTWQKALPESTLDMSEETIARFDQWIADQRSSPRI